MFSTNPNVQKILMALRECTVSLWGEMIHNGLVVNTYLSCKHCNLRSYKMKYFWNILVGQ